MKSIIVILSIILLFTCKAGVFASQSKQDVPFTVLVTVSPDEVCKGKTLSVKLEVINTSDKNIAIDKRSLRHRLVVERLQSESAEFSGGVLNIRGFTAPSSPSEGDYVVLAPKESYGITLALPLEEEFFQKAGLYRIIATYGQFRSLVYKGVPLFKGSVSSSGKEFKIINCDRK